MKTVFPNHNQCAHVWAAQSQSTGRSGPLWFNGPTIYSYGGHYPIATFVAPDLVLFNDTGSSMTTSGKHKPAVWRALHGHAARVICVPVSPCNSMRDIVAALVAEHAARLETAARSRKYTESNIERADATRANIEYLCARFDLPLPELPAFDRAAILARCAAQKVAQKERDADALAKREAYALKRKAEYITALAQWRVHGEYAHGALGIYGIDVVTALRLSADGSEVETSRGASVPKRDAFNLWRLITMRKASAQAWRPTEAVFVGSFQLCEILANGDAIVGCHTLTYAETSALAISLGWNV